MIWQYFIVSMIMKCRKVLYICHTWLNIIREYLLHYYHIIVVKDFKISHVYIAKKILTRYNVERIVKELQFKLYFYLNDNELKWRKAYWYWNNKQRY